MWFKEYTFNILIQPFHLLIYTVLVGAAMSLAQESLIYAIVAIYFVIPAEKLLRKFFKFDNAGTLSAAGSFAGGALFSAMISRINRPKPQDKDEEGGPKKRPLSAGNRANDTTHALTGEAGASGGTPTGVSGASGGNGTRASSAAAEGEGRTEGETTLARQIERNPVESDEAFIARVGARAPGTLREALNQRGFWARVGDAGRSYGYTMKSKAINGAKTLPKKLGRKLRRTAVGAAGAIPLGMLAIGAGAATGDPAKAAALAMAAGSAGYNFTNYYGDKLAKVNGAAMNSARTSFWGSQLKAHEQYTYDKNFKKSPELRDALMKVYNNKEDVDRAINSDTLQAFLNDGETDVGRIAKAMYLKDKVYTKAKVDPNELKEGEKNGYGLTERQAMERALITARMTRNFSPNAWITGTRENEVFERTMYNQFKAAGLSDNQISEEIKRILADQDVMTS